MAEAGCRIQSGAPHIRPLATAPAGRDHNPLVSVKTGVLRPDAFAARIRKCEPNRGMYSPGRDASETMTHIGPVKQPPVPRWLIAAPIAAVGAALIGHGVLHSPPGANQRLAQNTTAPNVAGAPPASEIHNTDQTSQVSLPPPVADRPATPENMAAAAPNGTLPTSAGEGPAPGRGSSANPAAELATSVPPPPVRTAPAPVGRPGDIASRAAAPPSAGPGAPARQPALALAAPPSRAAPLAPAPEPLPTPATSASRSLVPPIASASTAPPVPAPIPATTPAAPSALRRPIFVHTPSFREYLPYLHRTPVAGELYWAQVGCTATATGALQSCYSISETPQGSGFADAIVRLSGRFQIATTDSEGGSVQGRTLKFSIKLPQQ